MVNTDYVDKVTIKNTPITDRNNYVLNIKLCI